MPSMHLPSPIPKSFPGIFLIAAMLWAAAPASLLQAEDESAAWLRYAPLDRQAARKYASLPARAVVLSDSVVLLNAQQELIRGLHGMLGRTLRAENNPFGESAIILGTDAQIRQVMHDWKTVADIQDAFSISRYRLHGIEDIVVAGTSERGVLYGVFTLLSKIARNESIAAIAAAEHPSTPFRWVNQWDNLDGTIERGYAGPSIFFEDGGVRFDLTRAADYARLLASIGINGCVVNNVNADPRILDDNFLPQIARIADAFRPWGVQLALAVDLSSPKSIGGLETFDPLDTGVIEWWKDKVDDIYRQIPDLGGMVVKADSEGRPGPSSYGRTPADAANVIARALKGHGGVVFYRAFVYNHHLDWTNLKNDRARAAYDVFHPLDGQFDDNVIIQIKNGPIDFQPREPVSPLFGGLEKTSKAIELEITQEYTGQQRHLCFLPVMWKEILDFDLHAGGKNTPVREMVTGKTPQHIGGFIGVANVGMDNWLGSPLAMANLYGFGRLAWNPNLSARTIVDEWTRLTFGNDPVTDRVIDEMQLDSWRIYENYTGNLGIGGLTNILSSHYGPAPESSELNGWGQWHRADQEGVGMDRTIATGTGYIGQYSPAVQRLYESLKNCPDNLLLFFHHVPYAYVLHSGKTVIQQIYDSHYQGAESAFRDIARWESLRGRVDEERYADILSRFKYQAGHAIVWRDAICNYFYRLSAIPDQKGRVAHHPDRIEAEDMQLKGYIPVEVTPSETASGSEAVECPLLQSSCTATYRFFRPPGWYEMDVEYFDQNNGRSKFQVFLNNQKVDEWIAGDNLPATQPNGDSSTRRWIPGLALRPGDEIRIEGFPDGGELAPLDYIEIKR